MSASATPSLFLASFGEGSGARVWGQSAEERAARMAARIGRPVDDPARADAILAVSRDHVFEPQWLALLLERPGAVLTLGGRPVVAHLPAADGLAGRLRRLGGVEIPADMTTVAAETAEAVYNHELRKTQHPRVSRLSPATARQFERESYYGAYKGVTDVLTKYLWPELALHLTRLAARLGLSPNAVSAIGAVLCVLAGWLFWRGAYWPGVAAGFGFMVLDTVDGKLARCTLTSSRIGNLLDHGIDLVHPPFWWLAWAAGLGAWGLAFTPGEFWVLQGVIWGGYVLQRLVEGWFMRRFDMHVHVWRRFDSRFRLVTARRNPNMILLVGSLVAGRPDIGLVLVAGWTVASLLVHLAQAAQAERLHRRGRPIRSWLQEPT